MMRHIGLWNLGVGGLCTALLASLGMATETTDLAIVEQLGVPRTNEPIRNSDDTTIDSPTI